MKYLLRSKNGFRNSLRGSSNAQFYKTLEVEQSQSIDEIKVESKRV